MWVDHHTGVQHWGLTNNPWGIMKRKPNITCALVDIGGVLLSNGWDRHARKRAAEHFSLDLAELDERHHLNFEIYEIGKLTLSHYLSRVVFHRKREFSSAEFQQYMFSQSTPIPEMIALISQLKHQYQLKIVALSNEGKELNEYRIHEFQLTNIFDCFVSSCFVKMRKPDPDIFQLAFDMVQTPAQQIVFIDNTALFCDIARQMGMHSIHHQGYESSYQQFVALGLAPIAAAPCV
jgi:putative hydrolase of the HAD superfamily